MSVSFVKYFFGRKVTKAQKVKKVNTIKTDKTKSSLHGAWVKKISDSKSFLCIRKNIVSFKIEVFFCLLTICFSLRETSSFENQIEVQIWKQKKSNQI